MPMYEFECGYCDQRFEHRGYYDDPPFHVCPHCNSLADRVMSRTAFILKGGGWYKASPTKADGE